MHQGVGGAGGRRKRGDDACLPAATTRSGCHDAFRPPCPVSAAMSRFSCHVRYDRHAPFQLPCSAPAASPAPAVMSPAGMSRSGCHLSSEKPFFTSRKRFLARLRPVMVDPTFFCRMDALNKLVMQNGRYLPPKGVLSSILHKKFLRSVHSAIQMPGAGSSALIDARASMSWTSKTPAALPPRCLCAAPARRRGIGPARRHRSVPARRRSIVPARRRRAGLPRRRRSAPWSDTPLPSAIIRQRFSVMPLAKRGVASNMNNVHFEGEASGRRQVHEYRRHIAGGNPRGEP